MSHYNVNGSLAKTMIQHLVRWVIGSGQFDLAHDGSIGLRADRSALLRAASGLDREQDFHAARFACHIQTRQNGLLPSKSACALLMPISFSISSLSASKARRWRATSTQAR